MMTQFTKSFVLGIGLLAAPLLAVAQDSQTENSGAQEAVLEIRPADNLEQLLELVKERQLHWSKESKKREQRFTQRKSERQRLLRQAEAERASQEKISDELETKQQENEIRIGNLQEQLNNRLGTLRELFGVLQQVSGDARGVFQSSIVSAEIPGRGAWLDSFVKKMGTSTQLATIEEMENLWALLQEEMTATGQIAKFSGTIKEPDGQQKTVDIIRIGAFNLISDGKYLNYDVENDSIVTLSRQPSSRFAGTADDLFSAAPGELVGFGIDPTRGSLLSLLIQGKTLTERVEDGGGVGAVIIFLGTIGIALALFQLVYLMRVNTRVQEQMNSDKPDTSNPLGRILEVGNKNQDVDAETLELKLSEAILTEMPKLTRFLPIVQVISVVSPLLGLLGTVIGMILTFQAITLFGTGDPQTMAGGISTALMTTVLGLCAAIPTVLLHAIVSSRSRALSHVLEEQSTGIVAQQAEKAGRILG